jgi:hypothetical protein
MDLLKRDLIAEAFNRGFPRGRGRLILLEDPCLLFFEALRQLGQIGLVRVKG